MSCAGTSTAVELSGGAEQREAFAQWSSSFAGTIRKIRRAGRVAAHRGVQVLRLLDGCRVIARADLPAEPAAVAAHGNEHHRHVAGVPPVNQRLGQPQRVEVLRLRGATPKAGFEAVTGTCQPASALRIA